MKSNMQHMIEGVIQVDTDFKAEVVAASLLQQDVAAEKIFILRMGINNRTRNKDVKRLRIDFLEFNIAHIIIETNRESIYNYLPEGIFHPPTLGGLGKSAEDIVEKIRLQKKAEEDGKKFFIPFELESYFTELAALNFENNLDHKGLNNHLVDILSDLWPLLKELDLATAKVFIYLLPFFHSARGNKLWFEQCMTAFLGVPIKITFSANRVEEIYNATSLLLSNTRLGIDMLLCGSHTDGNRNWQINIGPVPANEIYRYVPASSFNKVLIALYNHCLPATTIWEQYIITVQNEEGFTLSTGDVTDIFLGYNTFL